MATGVDIDKHLFNSLHRLIALIEPGAGSNFERPLLAQSGRSRASSTTYFQARIIGISPGGAD